MNINLADDLESLLEDSMLSDDKTQQRKQQRRNERVGGFLADLRRSGPPLLFMKKDEPVIVQINPIEDKLQELIELLIFLKKDVQERGEI